MDSSETFKRSDKCEKPELGIFGLLFLPPVRLPVVHFSCDIHKSCTGSISLCTQGEPTTTKSDEAKNCEKHSDRSEKGCSTLALRYVMTPPPGNRRLQNGEDVFQLLPEDFQVIGRNPLPWWERVQEQLARGHTTLHCDHDQVNHRT